jgi:hypothetical protein
MLIDASFLVDYIFLLVIALATRLSSFVSTPSRYERTTKFSSFAMYSSDVTNHPLLKQW